MQFAHSSSFKPIQGAEAEAEGSAGDLKSLGDNRKRSFTSHNIGGGAGARAATSEVGRRRCRRQSPEPAAMLTAEVLSKWRSRLKFHDGFS